MRKDAKGQRLAAALMLCALACVYLVVCAQKKDYHTDEYYTFQLANSAQGGWFVIPQGEWINADAIGQQLVVQPGRQFDYAAVIRHESTDLHPFLYTALIHTVCSFFPGVFNMWLGLAVNIAFALPVVWLLFKCAMLLSQNDVGLSLIAGMLFGLSHGLLAQVVFIRMYVMAMFAAVLTVYLHLKNWERELRPPFFAALWATSAAGALTHYYYILFLVFCCMVFWGVLLLHKRYREAALYLGTEIAAAAAAVGIFPFMLRQILGGAEPSDPAQNTPWPLRAKAFLQILDRELFGGLGWLAALAGLCALAAWRILKRKQGRTGPQPPAETAKGQAGQLCFLLLPCVGVVLAASLTAPYLTDRYVSILYPEAVLLAVWGFQRLPWRKRDQRVAWGFAALSLLFLLGSYRGTGLDCLFRERTAILEQTELRKERDAVLLIPENCTWVIPSALSELKDYSALLVVPYSELGRPELAELLPEAVPANFYLYTWAQDQQAQDENLAKLQTVLESAYPGTELSYLWDSYYCRVYQCAPADGG